MTTASASSHVDASGAVGPDPMTPGSSRTGPTTSESANVTTSQRAAAARPPPFTADRCLRTAFSSSIDAPASSSSFVVACLSASVTPSAGAASSADAPPDSSTSSDSSGAAWLAQIERGAAGRLAGLGRDRMAGPHRRDRRRPLARPMRRGDQPALHHHAGVERGAHHRAGRLPRRDDADAAAARPRREPRLERGTEPASGVDGRRRRRRRSPAPPRADAPAPRPAGRRGS